MNAVHCLRDSLSGHEMFPRPVLPLDRKFTGQNVARIRKRMGVPLHRGVRSNSDLEDGDLGSSSRVGNIRCSIPRGRTLDKNFGLNLERYFLWGHSECRHHVPEEANGGY